MNLIFDLHTNETIFVFFLSSDELYVVVGQDSNKVKRIINPRESEKYKDYSYIQALELVRPGLR